MPKLLISRLIIPSLLLLIFTITSCSSDKGNGSSVPNAEAKVSSDQGNSSSVPNTEVKVSSDKESGASVPNAEEKVKQIAMVFMKGGSEAAALLKDMKPTVEDCKAIVNSEEDAKKLAIAADKMYAEFKATDIAPSKSTQTDILVRHSTTEALKAGKDMELPGGYTKKAMKFKDGLHIYGFKFVQPSETSGMAFDGLYHVNNKWVFIPKTWKHLD